MSNEYFKYIEEFDIASRSNQVAYCSSKIKTTELMTRLRHCTYSGILDKSCENPIDVLYLNLTGRKWYEILETLVIVYIPPETINKLHIDFSLHNRIITFTELKKMSKSYWIYKCDEESGQKIRLSNGKTMKIWEAPLQLEAVTDYDKDFRMEWHGDYVYEGNKFGDTSTFYIIGNLVY